MHYDWVESDSQTQSGRQPRQAAWLSISIGSQVRPQGQPAVQAFFLSRQPDNPPATHAKGKREGKREGGREGNELDSQPQISD